jgi:hypothetical protein
MTTTSDEEDDQSVAEPWRHDYPACGSVGEGEAVAADLGDQVALHLRQ